MTWVGTVLVRDQRLDIARSADQSRETILKEVVRPDAGCAGHQTGDGSDDAAEFVRAPGDGHRSRANASLDNDGGRGQRGHEPRPGNEAVARRHCARWNLADHEAEVSHSLKQFTVAYRVGAINAVRHDRDRVAA